MSKTKVLLLHVVVHVKKLELSKCSLYIQQYYYIYIDHDGVSIPSSLTQL